MNKSSLLCMMRSFRQPSFQLRKTLQRGAHEPRFQLLRMMIPQSTGVSHVRENPLSELLNCVSELEAI